MSVYRPILKGIAAVGLKIFCTGID